MECLPLQTNGTFVKTISLAGKSVTIHAYAEACNHIPNVKVRIVVPSLSVDWSETFTYSRKEDTPLSLTGVYYPIGDNIQLDVQIKSIRKKEMKFKVILS